MTRALLFLLLVGCSGEAECDVSAEKCDWYDRVSFPGQVVCWRVFECAPPESFDPCRGESECRLDGCEPTSDNPEHTVCRWVFKSGRTLG